MSTHDFNEVKLHDRFDRILSGYGSDKSTLTPAIVDCSRAALVQPLSAMTNLPVRRMPTAWSSESVRPVGFDPHSFALRFGTIGGKEFRQRHSPLKLFRTHRLGSLLARFLDNMPPAVSFREPAKLFYNKALFYIVWAIPWFLILALARLQAASRDSSSSGANTTKRKIHVACMIPDHLECAPASTLAVLRLMTPEIGSDPKAPQTRFPIP